MNSRISIRAASSTTPYSSDLNKSQRDDVSKIQQDINIVIQKIAELNGEPVPPLESIDNAGSSPFVIGLRALADSEKKYKDVKELKMNTMEKLLEKVGEYDRLLLKATAPPVDPTAAPQRRKSFGQDLFMLPTHLHLAARLMDLHTISKRVTVIKVSESGGSSSNNVPLNPATNDKKAMDALKATVTKQTKQLEDSESRRSKADEENTQLARNNKELKEQVAQLQASLATAQSQAKKDVASSSATAPNDGSTAELQTFKAKVLLLEKTNAELVAAVAIATATATAATTAATAAATAAALAETNKKSDVVDNSAEIAALKAKIVELEKKVSDTETKLSVEQQNIQNMVHATLAKAGRLNSYAEVDAAEGEECEKLVSVFFVPLSKYAPMFAC
jgi:hypothetical protein